MCGSTASIVGRYRRKHGIPAYEGYKFGKGQKPPSKVGNKKKAAKPRRRRSKIDAYREQVGKVPDSDIAELAGVSVEGVRMYRRRHNIALEDSARRRRGSRKAAPAEQAVVEAAEAAEAAAVETADAAAGEAVEVEAVAEPVAEERRPRRSRRSKIDPYRDQVGKVPDSEIAVMAEVTPEAVRMYRRKHDIPASWRDEAAPAPAPAPASAPAPAPAVIAAGSQGYAVSVTNNGETQEHIIIASDIAEAAQQAVARAEGTVTAVRFLGPALL